MNLSLNMKNIKDNAFYKSSEEAMLRREMKRKMSFIKYAQRLYPNIVIDPDAPFYKVYEDLMIIHRISKRRF